MNEIPTSRQIADIRRMLANNLHSFTAIARITGVRQQDVFRIAGAIVSEYNARPQPEEPVPRKTRKRRSHR